MTLKKITVLLASLLAILLGGLHAPAAASGDSADSANAYWIKFYHSGKCADNTGFSIENGNLYQQWTCVQQSNQLWYFESVGGDKFQIKNRFSGKCMHVVNYATGAAVYQNDCVGAAHAGGMWFFSTLGGTTPRGWYVLVNWWGSQCLNVVNASRNNGAKLNTWHCSAGYPSGLVTRVPY